MCGKVEDLSGEDKGVAMDTLSKPGVLRKTKVLRKRKANSSDEDEGGEGKVERSDMKPLLPSSAATSAKAPAPAKVKKTKSRGLSFETGEGGEEEEEVTFTLKKKADTKPKVLLGVQKI